MSWAREDLRKPILTIFAEAQVIAQRNTEADKLEREAAYRKEQARLLFHLDGRRKRKIRERAQTAEAKQKAHERYLRNRPAPQTRRDPPRCACGSLLSQGRHIQCGKCRFRAGQYTSRVISALAEGKTEREIATALGITKSLVHRIKVKNK